MTTNSRPHPPSQFIATFPARIVPSVQNHSPNTSPILDNPSKNMAPPPIASATDDKAKRLTACLVCRKRKLKCDSGRPKCASCTRLGHAWYERKRLTEADCSGYEETRKKSGPKQGYVKKLEQKSQTLEQRLAQLEKLLASHQNQQAVSPSIHSHLPTPPGISPLPFENLSTPGSASTSTLNQFTFTSTSPSTGINPNDMFTTQPIFPDLTPPDSTSINMDTFPLFRHDASPGDPNAPDSANLNPLGGTFGWDLVSLGMQEEFPPEELTNKL